MSLVYPSEYRPLRSPPPGRGVSVFWQSGKAGLIDPRPVTMILNSDRARRILDHGGVFIVLLDAKTTAQYCRGLLDRFGNLEIDEKHSFSNWSLLPEIGALEPQRVAGSEVWIQDPDSHLGRILTSIQDSMSYRCAFEPLGNIHSATTCLLRNKYDQCVGAHIARVGEKEEGHVLLLPPIGRFDEIVLDILVKWGIYVAPRLFPYHETTHWIHRPEYELPEVLEIRATIQDTRERANQRIRDLEQRIESARMEDDAWYRLLDGTGDSLVSAVIQTFGEFGFQHVEDVDAKSYEDADAEGRREDIQVLDCSPVLVVEVKGIGGKPSDPECTQAEKHAMMRMREWERTDVQALTIINHERHLPPDQREREPFRTEIVENAQQSGSGLMTSWDLFCLLRNARELSWPLDAVRSVLYQTGRVRPVPGHYAPIADIVEVWTHAVGIIPEGEISRGGMIAIEHDTSFFEFQVESLQVDDREVDSAHEGDKCGIKLPTGVPKLRKKSRVYKIVRSCAAETDD